MQKLPLFLSAFLLLFSLNLFGTATGHYPFTSLGFHDGTESSNYSVDPFGRQATGSANTPDYDIISTDQTDLFVVFDYDTQNKNVYLVYTTDGSAPTKTNGSVINCSFEKYNDPDRWWYGTIPSQAEKTVVKYIFYISDSDLGSAYGRVAADGYKTSWTEGDSYFGYAVSANANSTYHTVYFLGDEAHDWRFNEHVATDGNSNFYISWDDETLFIAVFTTDLDFTKTDPDRLNIGIDADPGGTNGDASTAFAGYNFSTNNDGLHKLDYIVQVADEFPTNVRLFDGVDGSFDTGTDKSYVMLMSQRYIEIGIPWSDLGGRPTSNWSTILWTSNHYDSWVMSSYPVSNPTGDASTPLDVVEYHTYNTAGANVSPGTDGNDSSLPVTLSSFTAEFSNNGVNLHWTTQSEVDVLGYEIQRALSEDGPFTTIASYRDYAELRAQGNYSAKTDYQFTDGTITPGFTYWYKLISHDLDGSRQTFGPISVSVQNNADIQPGSVPGQYQLEQNFPNPFNLSTEIRFGIPKTTKDVQPVNLSVYDMNGKKIVELLDAPLSAGSYRVFWNGTDATGKVVPTGIYFYRLSTPQFVQARKMLLVK
jgi:hypothetical protein